MNEHAFRSELAGILNRYQRWFPSEAGALGDLRAQLARDGDLRSRATTPGHVTASALILNSNAAAILLIYHMKFRAWMQPGGHIEAAESAIDAALREANEETGLKDLVLHEWHAVSNIPIDIDTHAINMDGDSREPAHQHHDLRYVLKVPPDGDVRIDTSEVGDYRWVSVQKLESLGVSRSLLRAAHKIERTIMS